MAKTTRTRASGAKSGASKTKASTQKAASSAPETNDHDDFDELAELQALSELEAEAQAAAEAAAKAKQAFLARRVGMNASASSASASSAEAAVPQGPLGSGDYLDMLSRVFDDMSANDWDPDKFDDMTRGVGMVLGSGPAFAALGSMLANSTAQGSVLVNATQMQRQLDQVGLCTTSACVKQLLSLNESYEPD